MKNNFKETRDKGVPGRRNRMCKFLEARGSVVGLHVFCYELESRTAERLRVVRWARGNP